MKTSELTGAALDWAVAKCESTSAHPIHTSIWRYEHFKQGQHNYSTNWAQGGPIIEREKIGTTPTSMAPGFEWEAHCIPDEGVDYYGYGPTPLIAAMRCYVASKLGDEVNVPEELK